MGAGLNIWHATVIYCGCREVQTLHIFTGEVSQIMLSEHIWSPDSSCLFLDSQQTQYVAELHFV